MPARRTYKRRPTLRRRRYVSRKSRPTYIRRRTARSRRLTPKLTRFTTGVPDRMIVRMTYEDVYSITAPNQRQWRLNSIFDPDFTGVGHQPRGHDQWASFFQSYRVFACKAKFFIQNTDDTGALTIGLIPDNTAGSYINTYLSEVPKCRTVQLASGDGGIACKSIYYKASIPHILGYTSQQYKNNEDCKCAFGTSPAEIAYLTLVCQSLNTYSGAVNPTQVRATFTYYVELFDRVELASS